MQNPMAVDLASDGTAALELSLTHYHPEFSLPIVIEDIIFRVPGVTMSRRSRVLREKMEENEIVPEQYYGDSGAMKLTVVSVKEFTALLDYIILGIPFDDENADEYSSDILILLLKASTKLCVKDARNLAIHHLEQTLNSIDKCRLSVDLNIASWFQSSCFALMSISSLSLLSREQCLTLGGDLLHEFIKIRARIDRLRISLAFDIPPFTADTSCLTVHICHKSWLVLWQQVMTSQLRAQVAVKNDIFTTEMFMSARKKHTKGTCDRCMDLYLGEAKVKGYFAKEELLMEQEMRRLARERDMDCIFFPQEFRLPVGLSLDDF